MTTSKDCDFDWESDYETSRKMGAGESKDDRACEERKIEKKWKSEASKREELKA